MLTLEEHKLSVRVVLCEIGKRIATDAAVLHVVAAEEGESIEEFSRRTGNEWKPSFTAVMNNIPEDRLLEEGQYLKIVKSERYTSN